MIRAVIFDFGGTLANTKTPWDIVSERIAERLELEDIKVDPVDLEEAINATIGYRREQHELGLEIDSYRFFNYALGKLGYTLPVDITDELEQIVFQEGYTSFVENLDDILMNLSEEYMLALLSNSWLEAPRQILREHGYGRWFKVMLCSYDIGIAKPDPRVFRHVLDLLGVHPHEAVMVGDSLEADINGAITAGMKAVLIHDGFSDWAGPKIVEFSELPDLLHEMDV
jgi:putative hydrolase of the HAD superfamily